jgi:hypothetical protein
MRQPAIDGLATIATYDCRDFKFPHLQFPLFHDVLEVSVARWRHGRPFAWLAV